jgi:dihydroxyacetone kinase-like predicted kinase
VILLTNSTNVIMAAEHAARLSDKQVLVVPTASQQAGLAAAVALNGERSIEENGQALEQALAHVRTGAVAPAARDDVQGRFETGDAVGFVEEDVIAWGEPQQTLQAVIAALEAPSNGHGQAELIGVISGEGAPLSLTEIEAMAGADTELELRHGGQPAYWWLLTAE